jgi:HPt (histidine-containing phosphotransfer) domain-containing protein
MQLETARRRCLDDRPNASKAELGGELFMGDNKASSGIFARRNALDIAHLDEQTRGDRQLQSELLRLFTAQSPSLFAQMHQVSPDNSRHLDDLAHRLKGSALAIGAFGVAYAADGIGQRAASDGGAELAALAQALAQAQAAIDAHLEALDAQSPARPPRQSPAGA